MAVPASSNYSPRYGTEPRIQTRTLITEGLRHLRHGRHHILQSARQGFKHAPPAYHFVLGEGAKIQEGGDFLCEAGCGKRGSIAAWRMA